MTNSNSNVALPVAVAPLHAAPNQNHGVSKLSFSSVIVQPDNSTIPNGSCALNAEVQPNGQIPAHINK